MAFVSSDCILLFSHGFSSSLNKLQMFILFVFSKNMVVIDESFLRSLDDRDCRNDVEN